MPAMNAKILSAYGLALFVLLSLADLYITWLIIQNSGGHINEGNPFAKAWLERFGWQGLVIFKIAAITVVVGVVLVVARYRPRTSAALVSFACLAVFFVLYYSYQLQMQAIR